MQVSTAAGSPRARGIGAIIKRLTGAADRVVLVALPFLAIGLVLNFVRPDFFTVGGPSAVLRTVSAVVLVPGVIVWLWSVILILTRVPRGELITTGPFRLVKHPLYTGVALLVLPWAGFLLNSSLGLIVGIALYVGSRLYAPAEEKSLAEAFGPEWDAYERRVLLPWL